jgi:hypothetical protein
MNPTDLIIGLGLGVITTLIVKSVKESRQEKQDRREKFLHSKSHDDIKWHIETANDRFKSIFPRLEKLEARTKILDEISIKALHDNYANIVIAVSKDKRK